MSLRENVVPLGMYIVWELILGPKTWCPRLRLLFRPSRNRCIFHILREINIVGAGGKKGFVLKCVLGDSKCFKPVMFLFFYFSGKSTHR